MTTQWVSLPRYLPSESHHWYNHRVMYLKHNLTISVPNCKYPRIWVTCIVKPRSHHGIQALHRFLALPPPLFLLFIICTTKNQRSMALHMWFFSEDLWLFKYTMWFSSSMPCIYSFLCKSNLCAFFSLTTIYPPDSAQWSLSHPAPTSLIDFDTLCCVSLYVYILF